MHQTSTSLRSIGYVLLAVATLLFLVQIFFLGSSDFLDGSGFFLINYGISVIFWIMMIFEHKGKHGWKKNWLRMDEHIYSIALVLFSISAHTLNYGTDIKVFWPYVNWMIGYILLMHVAILLLPYREKFSDWAQYVLYFIAGAGLCLSLYMTIFIGPLLLFSLPMALFIGISLHSYIPFFYFLYFLLTGLRKLNIPHSKTAYWSGVLVPVLVLIVFLARWHGVQQTIENSQEAYYTTYKRALPEWVVLSQQLPNDPLTESVITSKVFSQKSMWENSDFMSFRESRIFEIRHDPLAVMADLMYGHIDLDENTLIHLLESQYDGRHETHRRLWSGDDLSTTDIKTDIEVFPDFRLAYMEKTLTIKNDVKKERWNRGNQQEAIYSFHLPEGALATSLSLWIEGVEQKARLTTRAKADSAYATIVGRERRDPALLHWQEGNRVTVTVFPCTPDEDRQFKIGFTLPLSYNDGNLSLKNVWFDGPTPQIAQEKVSLQITGSSLEDLSKPKYWDKIDESTYLSDGLYRPDWELTWKAPTLSETPFIYENQSYSIHSLETKNTSLDAQHIIMDVNSSWNWHEVERVWEKVKAKNVYAFTPERTQVTEENYQEVMDQLKTFRFSLIPLHELTDLEHTLVISQNRSNSPYLSDLEEDEFAKRLRTFLKNQDSKVKWYDLGSKLAPYVSSLQAFKVVEIVQGDIEGLDKILAENVFPNTSGSTNQISILQSGITIEKTTLDSLSTIAKTKSPDHLKRVFDYNELLHLIGRQYFDREALEETWIRKAEEAFVVSPVSSLVVLETQKDYERFGIDENADTLGNASLSDSGAVPEPHEWALILLVGCFMIWQMRKKFSLVK